MTSNYGTGPCVSTQGEKNQIQSQFHPQILCLCLVLKGRSQREIGVGQEKAKLCRTSFGYSSRSFS